MNKLIAGAALAVLTVLSSAGVASATPAEKVTICHRTNSDKNPYVLITVSANAVDGEGANDHTHHIVDEQHSRADIIPADFTEVDLNGDDDTLDKDEVIYFCPGSAGTEGPAGPAGPAGPKGDDGAPGQDGATGPAGPAGASGATGPAGAAGSAGATGPAGANGADGAVGPAGPAGTLAEAGAPATAAQPTELPRTGAAGTALMLGIGAFVVAMGLGLRKMSRI